MFASSDFMPRTPLTALLYYVHYLCEIHFFQNYPWPSTSTYNYWHISLEPSLFYHCGTCYLQEHYCIKISGSGTFQNIYG